MREQPAPTVLELVWLITALLVPLWVNLWAQHPFELSKVLLLRSAAWLLTGLWVVDRLRGGSYPCRVLPRNALLGPVVLLAGVLLLVTVFAVDPLVSLFGTATRGQGFLTLISYFLFFAVVGTRLCDWAQVMRLLVAMVTTAAPLVVVGLLQAFGWDPIGLVTDARAPVYATLGRANFVGSYLAMLLPLTLALALTAQEMWRRGLLILLAGGQLTVIAVTLARGAWLAAGASLTVFSLLFVWPRLNPARRRPVLVGAVLVSLAFVALGGVMVWRAEGGSMAARRTIWTAVGALIRERPVWGYGPDSVPLVFPRVYPPQLVYYQGRDVFVDRAHNVLLDWTVMHGALGALAFSLVLGVFLVVGLGRFRAAVRVEGGGRRLSAPGVFLAASLAAVAGNLIGNMVSFDVTATAMVMWLLMALVTSPAMAEQASPAMTQTSEPNLRHREEESGSGGRWWRRAAAGLVLLGTGMAIVQFNARPLLASVAHRAAVRRVEVGDSTGAVRAAGRAVWLWPWEVEHQWLLGQVIYSEAELSRVGVGEWARAEAAFLTARDLRPQDYATWVLLGDFYAAAGTRVDAEVFAHAHRAYERAVSLAPHNARLYVGWARAFLAEERPDAALARLRRAVDLDATDALAWRLIGDVELVVGSPETALDAFRESVRWAPGDVLAHVGLARAYWVLGEPDAARGALESATALDPGNLDVRAMWEQVRTAP